MNANKKSFFTLAALVLASRLADALTTFIGSPDLRYELNPVVSVFHMGWTGLFLATTAITCGVLYLAYLHYCHPLRFDLSPVADRHSLRAFATHISFGPHGKFSDFLYRLPQRELLMRWAGYVGSYGLLFYGTFVVVNNLILIYPNYLTSIWIDWGFASRYADVAFILATVSLLTVAFFKAHYNKAMIENGVVYEQ